MGTDARHFTLDEFGALSFVESPDYDRETNGNHGDTYYVTLHASDENNLIGSLPVTVTLTNVDEPPIISGSADVTLNEGHTSTVSTYTRRDPEGLATNWAMVGQAAALTGADASQFEFDKPSGRLTFASPPDYEDGGGRYDVTLNANDGSRDGALDIVVMVTNLEEPGSLTLPPLRPILNRPLTATLEDGDGVVSETWQWQRSTSRSSGWTDIVSTNSSSYTPAGADRDHYLRATVEYTDGIGAGKRLQATSGFTAVNDRLTNTPPALPDSVDPISIREDTRAGRNVGSPIRATDEDNDPLAYELSGSGDFVIDGTSAQIKVADGVTLDFDAGQASYPLTVTADDGFGGTDTVGVTINITGVNEAPQAVDDAPRSFDEDTSVTIDVLVNDSDPENDDLTVTSVTRPSSGSATLESDSTITYTPRSNYSGSDSFTYRARDPGGLTSGTAATVALTIDGVNDAPTFASATAERTVSESAAEGDDVGAPVTATDIDGDDLTYRLSGAGAFAFDIDEDGQITVGVGTTFDIATQDTYGVTVDANDGEGGSASADVTITVTTGPVGPPSFSPAGVAAADRPAPRPARSSSNGTSPATSRSSTAAMSGRPASGPTASRSGSSRTAPAPTTPSTSTTSPAASASRSSSSSSTTPTSRLVASGPTAQPSGSPTAARKSSSPTTSRVASASPTPTSRCTPTTTTRAASGPTARKCGSSTTATTPSSATTSRAASCSPSTLWTTTTATRTASSPTASASGSPTTATSASSPTACQRRTPRRARTRTLSSSASRARSSQSSLPPATTALAASGPTAT